MTTRTNEQLMLGDSLETILSQQEQLMPVISEYQFEREVLGLLENPFDAPSVQQYAIYVGELTKPLNVVDNNNRNQILFTVPALVQSPITTIPTGSGITADTFMRSLNRDMELGGRQLNSKITEFMTALTHKPNYLDVVIAPIQEILMRYNRQMVPLPGVEAPKVPTNQPGNPTSAGSSFSDDYED